MMAFMALFGLALAAVAAETPTYKFEPGLELVYEKSGKEGVQQILRATVTNRNADGSWHVVVLTKSVPPKPKTEAKPANEPEIHRTAAWRDLTSEGRVIAESEEENAYAPQPFPPLPAAGETNWTKRWELEDMNSRFALLPETSPRELKFVDRRDGLMSEIYSSKHRVAYRFDRERGFLLDAVVSDEPITDKDDVPYKYKWSNSGRLKLVETNRIDESRLAEFKSQASAYFTAQKERKELGKNAEDAVDPTTAKALTAKTIEPYKAARPKITHADFAALLDETLKNADRYVRWAGEDAEKRGKLLNKPSPEWSATDFNGKRHSSKDYRGKVVVLDFWYRGCGWCIRSMPQLKALANDYADKPVAVLGINIDNDPEDAKFVIRRAGLGYPNLQFGSKSKVKESTKPSILQSAMEWATSELLASNRAILECTFGYPTLLVIDKNGKIAHIHVGYSPTLRKDLAKAIDGLLAK